MNEFRMKLGENGRLVIPQACRKQLHFKPGEQLIFRMEGDELRLFSLKHSLHKAQELLQQYTKEKDLVWQFKKMRQEDAGNE